jgi:hypothetical protein
VDYFGRVIFPHSTSPWHFVRGQGWVELSWIGLGWIGLGWTRMGRADLSKQLAEGSQLLTPVKKSDLEVFRVV